MVIYFSSFILFLLFNPSEGQTVYPKLRLVQVVYRHGARSPLFTYPTDPNGDYPWPQGMQQLLPIGMQKSLELGQFIKQRYTGFLSEEYVIDEIYVRSSDEDRTVMTAECVLTGMYPTIPQQTWNPNYTWQPTSLHTVPEEYDHVTGPHKLDWGPYCPRYKLLLDQTAMDPDYKALNSSYQDLYAYLNANGGTQVTDPYILSGYLDATECARVLDLPTPDWITDEVYRALANEIHRLRWIWMFGGKGGLEKKVLFCGGLPEKLISYMHDHLTGRSTYKMVQYSTHDDVLAAALMMTLQDNDEAVSHFGFNSAIFYELQEVASLDFRVHILFRNGTNDTLVPVPVVGCSDALWCPFHEFEALIGVYRISDQQWPGACGILSQEKTITYGLIGMAVAILMLVMLMVTLALHARTIHNELEMLKQQNEQEKQDKLQAQSDLSGPRRLSESTPLLGDRRRFDIRV